MLRMPQEVGLGFAADWKKPGDAGCRIRASSSSTGALHAEVLMLECVLLLHAFEQGCGGGCTARIVLAYMQPALSALRDEIIAM